MLRRLILCAVFSGCGFQSVAVTDGGSAGIGDGGPGDGARDGSRDGSADCLGHWLTGDLAFSTPQELTSLSTGGNERDPWISPDGRTLYFASNQAGTNDIYRSSRDSPMQPFVTATRLVNLSQTDKEEDRASLTADEKTLVLSSDRGGPKSQIYIITRPDTAQDFGSPNQDHLNSVNTSNADQFDPFLTADGLKLYLAPNPNSPAHQQIMVATRTEANPEFTAPVVVAGINNASGTDNADPAVSLDERIIVFSSDRAGGLDLWYATRPDTEHDFGAPVPIPTVNSGKTDGDPVLSADGCELYFSSTRNGPDLDLFVAQIAH